MRSPAEQAGRIARRCAFVLILVPAWASCLAHSHASAPASAPPNGPAADYPVVIGQPYRIGMTLYTPADAMNYDEVGYLAIDGGQGIAGASHTLPLPSDVEVTSLETGKTILVRIERRGPMTSDALIALTPAALTQLGAAAGAPVRVRRANPPEEERAVLRAGQPAPPRMYTPASLVAALKRKLPGEGSASLQAGPKPVAVAKVDVSPSTAAIPGEKSVEAATMGAPPPLPPLPARVTPSLVTQTTPPRAASATAERGGAFVVQAATMSTFERAQQVAHVVGGSVSKAGSYYRVHTGPFASRQQAEASLAKVRAAGYSDARIYTNG